MITAFACVLAALSLPQDGGKLPWRGKGEDPAKVLEDSIARKRPALIFFTSDG